MKNRFFFFVSIFVLIGFQTGWSDGEKVLYEKDSLYHHIRVSEEEGYRYLSFNRSRGSQSAVNVKNPFELKFAYTRASFVVPAFLDQEPERILYIGLGGGSIPKVMAKHYPNAQMDIVEIDTDVVDVAKQYFFFDPTPMMNIHVMDGRRFVRSCPDRYDLIFLDAYNDRAIPFHLTTQEFFKIVKLKLKPNGVVASNVWGPRNDKFYLSELKTYQQIFPHIYLIDSITTNNYILIADSQERVMTRTLLEERIPYFQNRFQFDFSLLSYVRTLEDLSQKTVNAEVLSDDFAPVEVLRSQKVDTQ